MQVASQAIRLGTTLVLARLLTPADFGIVAYALTIITFVDVFKHMGAIAAIIERPTISQRLLSSLFYMNVFTGLVLGIIFALVVARPGEFDRFRREPLGSRPDGPRDRCLVAAES